MGQGHQECTICLEMDGIQIVCLSPRYLHLKCSLVQECRNFLVKDLAWIPPNCNYEDGMRLIHGQLQLAFGDENMDLALGVLEELIELEAPPSFPHNLYQHWTHAHRRRFVSNFF